MQVQLENVSGRPYTAKLAGRETIIPAGHAVVCEEGDARVYVPWERDSTCPADGAHKIGPHDRFNSDAEYDRYLRRFRHRHGYFDGKPQGFATAEMSDGTPFKPPLRIRPYVPAPVVLAPQIARAAVADAEEFAGLGEPETPEPVTVPVRTGTARVPAKRKPSKGRR
jgi:hypothetical protein